MSRALLSQTGAKVEFIKDTILKQWLNISDFSQLDVDILVKANVSTNIEYYLGHMISDRALLGWSTHGVIYKFNKKCLTYFHSTLRWMSTCMPTEMGLKTFEATTTTSKLGYSSNGIWDLT